MEHTCPEYVKPKLKLLKRKVQTKDIVIERQNRKIAELKEQLVNCVCTADTKYASLLKTFILLTTTIFFFKTILARNK